MMLRISSNNINPTTKMFCLTVRKNLGLIILTLAVALLICPGYMIISFDNLYENNIVGQIGEWIKGITVFSSVIGLLGTFVYNIINLSYMFSKSSSDAFHSVPLTRGELLFSRALSGIFSTLVPIIALFISLIGMSALYACLDIYIVKLLLCFAFVVVSTLVFWSLSVMFAVCAGAIFDYILSYIGANLGVLLTAVIVNELLNTYLTGYTNNFPIFKVFSPVYYCMNTISLFLYEKMTGASIVTFFVISIVIAAVFTVISYFLYKNRKAEKAGSAYAYRFIYLICGFIASFCGAYAVGVMFSLGEVSLASFWIFAAIGAVLTAVAYGAITNRGFKKLKRSVLLGIVSVATMGILTILFIIDPTGFSRRIPKEENIQSVMLNIDGVEQVTYTDNNLPVDLHRRIVKDGLSQGRGNYGDQFASVDLEYTLKNGKTMIRSYTVLKNDINTEYYRYYSSDEHFDIFYNGLMINKNGLVDLSYYTNDNYFSGEISNKEFKELLEIYQAEIKTIPDILKNDDINSHTFSGHWNGEQMYTSYYTSPMYLNKKTVKTNAYIETLINQQKIEMIK